MTSENESVETEASSKQAEQEARATLRDSFLRAVNDFNGQSCNILTYEKSSLDAIFTGWKPDGSEILVRDLKTPALVNMSSAKLRTPDIIAIKFDKTI